MESPASHSTIDAAFDEVEGAILPSVAMLLDSLLDSAVLALPGVDAAAHASELRSLALQVENLTGRVAALVPAQEPERLRMSA